MNTCRGATSELAIPPRDEQTPISLEADWDQFCRLVQTPSREDVRS